ncbi:hypothetical protein EYF80_045362 [Liparis tanakae]|uniref:Uncharacterized protein n=1 Tax=Liparis tanakae TaxID=230148 RepID=A0A4Z2FTC8_9TELE|nr:hypothetical protein EYF80_045362 [Liparis tanakae]
MKAVATLEAHSSTAWPSRKFPSGIQPKITAAMEARKPTTLFVAPVGGVANLHLHFKPQSHPDNRLPLSPSSAGTRMNTSDTSVNTVQCCNDHHETSSGELMARNVHATHQLVSVSTAGTGRALPRVQRHAVEDVQDRFSPDNANVLRQQVAFVVRRLGRGEGIAGPRISATDNE